MSAQSDGAIPTAADGDPPEYDQSLRVPADLAPAQRRLRELAHATSHDLRAPLRGIAMLADWLEEDLGGVLTGASQEHMQLLRRQITRLEGMLGDLARYSQSCGGAFEVETTDTARLMSTIVGVIDPPTGFAIEVRPPLPVLETASGALKAVLLELVGNAVKHHDRPAGKVVVSAVDAGDFLEFSVTDDGPGIPVVSHQRLFKLFHTLQPRAAARGNGMGLAIARVLVEDAGGGIAVESDGPRGARFRFTWPKLPSRTWSGLGA